ncbi:DUF1643 domain-containing protein [Micromonospora sp. MED01]|uniref:DUF1643 domain-containing protein n=1 Tax=Micromonospora alfalfae TaxID=2911212 RepID=UPI001EE9767D|nr:DUF1643 domain-containing protein [Micromonospora alfalfae]MCG5464160.1 DUF1643 domain-containing protein [Micromonospora alfalfae]
MADHLVTDRAPSLFGGSTATFSACRTWRYSLTRRWQPNGAGVTFLMLNPSVADAFKVDRTVARCMDFARRWGFGGLLVLNCFALRSTDPAALKVHPDPVGPDNDTVIAEWLGRLSGPVVAAWGVHATYQDRAAQVTELVRAAGRELVCLGTTKEGHPRHPLYVPGATKLTTWPGGDGRG